VSEVRALVESYEHHLWRAAFPVDPARQADHDARELAAAAGAGRAWVATVDGSAVGVIALADRPWESQYYPHRMMHVPHVVAAGSRREAVYDALIDIALAGVEGSAHMLVRAPPEDDVLIRSLERARFHHTATMVQSLYRRPSVVPRAGPGWIVREANENDWPHLLDLMTDVLSAMSTRYTMDSTLPREGTRRLYRGWAEESRAGRFADVNLVVIAEGREHEPRRLDGFASARLHPTLTHLVGRPVGELTIGGMNPRWRGRGGFHAIVPELLARLWDHGASYVGMLTQIQNMGSLRVAQHLGSRLVSAHHCYQRLVVRTEMESSP
jgi:GNAT superfamily N-acetyltransferase